MKNDNKEKRAEDSENNEKNHEEKKYQFIKEQIRPQGKHRIRRMTQRVGFVLGMTVLFCGISVVTFYIMRRYLPVESLGAEVIYMTPSPSGENTATRDMETNPVGNALTSLEEYSRISQEMAAKGAVAQKSLVKLYTDSDSMHVDDSESYPGIMIQKSSQNIYILTEYALSQKARSAQAVFYDDSGAEATLVGADNSAGFAVYRIQLTNVSAELQEQIIPISSEVRGAFAVGTPVLVIGKANGVFHSVHTGIVTNGQLTVPVTDSELNLCTADITYSKDAAGYVLNTKGEMIGVLTTDYVEKTGTTDTAFISVESIQNRIHNMIMGLSPARLGVIGSAVNAQEAKRLNLEQGIYIEQLDSASPAYRGGMRVADVIMEVAGTKVSTPTQLQEELQRLTADDKVQITISRKGAGGPKKQKLNVTLG
ncbi:MAG: serine protease [Lachnospiraceae bacterium]|nr:serine protease [Lachnospiraceae bacterium]